MATITRDEFEEWLEANSAEAIECIEDDRMPLKTWIRYYGKALAFAQAEEESNEDDEDDVQEDDDLAEEL